MKCGDPNNPAGPYIVAATGKPCGKDVVSYPPNSTRCVLHGGNAPSSRIRAEQQLAQARLPAIETLFTIIEQFNSATCLACGLPDGSPEERRIALTASVKVLDRTGFGPSATLNIAPQSDSDLQLELLTHDEHVQLIEALGVIRTIKDAVKARMQAVTGAMGYRAIPEVSTIPVDDDDATT